MILYVAAGAGRSGSTLLYNMVRVSAQVLHRDIMVSVTPKDSWLAVLGDGVGVVKLHGFSKRFANAADAVFTCKRDVREQAASEREHYRANKGRVLSDKELFEYVSGKRKERLLWEGCSSFTRCFDYEDLVEHPEKVAREIYVHMGGDGSEAFEIVDRCLSDMSGRITRNRPDKVTGMTPNHITSAGKEWHNRLSSTLVEKLEELIR